MSHYDIVIEQLAASLFFTWLLVLFGLLIHTLRTATPPVPEYLIEEDEMYTYDDARQDLLDYAEVLGQQLYDRDVREQEI